MFTYNKFNAKNNYAGFLNHSIICIFLIKLPICY